MAGIIWNMMPPAINGSCRLWRPRGRWCSMLPAWRPWSNQFGPRDGPGFVWVDAMSAAVRPLLTFWFLDRVIKKRPIS